MRAAAFGVSRLFNTISDRADESVPSGADIKVLTPSPSECDCCLEVIKIKQVLRMGPNSAGLSSKKRQRGTHEGRLCEDTGKEDINKPQRERGCRIDQSASTLA